MLYTTEETYIDDITITTEFNGTSGKIKKKEIFFHANFTILLFAGIVTYDISIEGNDISTVKVTVRDKEGSNVVSKEETSFTGTIVIDNVLLWWPYLMDADPGYLYTLRVKKL